MKDLKLIIQILSGKTLLSLTMLVILSLLCASAHQLSVQRSSTRVVSSGKKSFSQAVDTTVEMVKDSHYGIPMPVYVEEVLTKVVKIIQSYTGIVNKMVWRKA